MNETFKTEEPILQAVAVPFRERDGVIEFCLITSRSGKNWIFPKGIVDPGETPAESAVRESYEEAGLHGHIVGQTLGEYDDYKWGHDLRAMVMLMEVTQCDEDWQEAIVRDRRWLPTNEARELLSKEEQIPFLELAIETLGAE